MNEYDEGRIWYKKKGGVVTVGLTEKAVDEIGGIQGLSLPVEGDEIQEGDVVGEIEGEKTTFEVIAPLSGTIEAVNEELNHEYEVLESDSLDEGWIYKIRVVGEGEEEE